LVYSTRRAKPKPNPLALARLSRYFPPAVAQVYIVSFRTHDDRRPSKRYQQAWEHGGPDFQSRFDKSTAQAQEMKERALRIL